MKKRIENCFDKCMSEYKDRSEYGSVSKFRPIQLHLISNEFSHTQNRSKTSANSYSHAIAFWKLVHYVWKLLLKMENKFIAEKTYQDFPAEVPVPEPLPPVPSSLKKCSSIRESFAEICLSICFLELSIMWPPIIISSSMKYA